MHGRGERTRTFDLTVPNRARYQLRHTPKVEAYHTKKTAAWLGSGLAAMIALTSLVLIF